MPLFEAVVNSIHAIEESNNNFKRSSIEVQIIRTSQTSFNDIKSDGNIVQKTDQKFTHPLTD